MASLCGALSRRAGPGAVVLVRGLAALALAWTIPVEARAQQSAAAQTPLVLDGVTVVDVEQGKLVPAQRVVITGNRIQAVGAAREVTIPNGANVVKATGKYLIPGLWDMHHHAGVDTYIPHLLLLANGVTGFRDAGTAVPLDTLKAWRREILAGTRVGPPRQILGGFTIFPAPSCAGEISERPNGHVLCVQFGDSADAHNVVAARKAAGAEMLKIYTPAWEVYAAARRLGMSFGGHRVSDQMSVTAIEASDSGARILDHSMSLGEPCAPSSGSVEECRQVADRLRRNGTWWSPTCIGVIPCGRPEGAKAVYERYAELISGFIDFSVLNPYAPDGPGHDALRTAMPGAAGTLAAADSADMLMRLPQEAGMPIVAGTDALGQWPPQGSDVSGFALLAELAMDVAEGLTPLTALQSATLNPAKLLGATDSLGTVAAGKLADLVLLDADPLADITNTTRIRAVVANGRYFDRGALDAVLAEAQATAKGE